MRLEWEPVLKELTEEEEKVEEEEGKDEIKELF